jgi:hypothetical protein
MDAVSLLECSNTQLEQLLGTWGCHVVNDNQSFYYDAVVALHRLVLTDQREQQLFRDLLAIIEEDVKEEFCSVSDGHGAVNLAVIEDNPNFVHLPPDGYKGVRLAMDALPFLCGKHADAVRWRSRPTNYGGPMAPARAGVIVLKVRRAALSVIEVLESLVDSTHHHAAY